MARGVRVRMRNLAASPLGVWTPGMEITVSEAVAKQLLDGGYAEPVGTRPPEVRAPAPPPAEDLDDLEPSPPPARTNTEAPRGRKQG